MGVENNIPEGWVDTTLGEIANITMGQSPKSDFYNTEGNGMPFYQGVTEFNDRYVGVKNFTTKTTKVVPKNSILFSVRAPVGKVNFTKSECCIGRGNAGMFMENGNQNFLYYLLKLSERKLQDYSSGTVFTSISGKELNIIPVLVPKKQEEQKAIANVLTAFDDKIELLQAQNKTLETMAQTIFKEWFGKYQIGDELPVGWRVGKLGDVMDIFDSKRVPLSKAQREAMRGDYRYYGATKVMDYVNDYLFDGIYLLFAEDGSVMDDDGYPFLQYVWGKFWVNNHTHILKGKNSFSTELLYVLCKKMKVAGIVNGAVQLKINQRNLLSKEIILPNDSILEKVDYTIQPLFNKLRINSSQIQSLTKTRDTLLPKLMSGQVRVKNLKQTSDA